MLSPNPCTGTLSLVIAITGHRELNPADIPLFESRIAAIFEELRAKDKYPHTPLLLLSGLADGADRLAVRMARAAVPPVQYVAILPMREDLYRADFVSERSDVEFGELLRGAERVVEIPLKDGVTDEAVSAKGSAARNAQYEQLGKVLVQYSQILIAIWDRGRPSLPGGTTQVVNMKLRRDVPPGRLTFASMNADGAGPTYVLPAREVGAGSDQILAFNPEPDYPEASDKALYHASYLLQDQFNEDVRQAGSWFPAAVEQSRKDLFEGAEVIGIQGSMEWAQLAYARADALANYFQAKTLRVWNAAFVALGLAAVPLALLHSSKENSIFFCAYYGGLLVAAVLIWLEQTTQRRGRHEDYRALAEALRVQFFWMAAGLPDIVADHYLRKHAGEMMWIRDALSECGLYADVFGRAKPDKADRPMRLELAHRWVHGQANYFSDKHKKNKRKQIGFMILGATVGLLGCFWPLFGLLVGSNDWPHAVAPVALYWAALTWNYIELRGYKELARQYGRMYGLFHDADEDLKLFERNQDFDSIEKAIQELGGEALRENADWLVMHRERKLTPRNLLG